MGGCVSQQSESQALLSEILPRPAVERSAGEVIFQKNDDQIPAQVGSSEYLGAYMPNGMAHQNTPQPTLPVSYNQTKKPALRVSPDVYENPSLPFDVLIGNIGRQSVDQPMYPTVEEQPIVERAVHNQMFKQQAATLPFSNNKIAKTVPPVSSNVHNDYPNGNEPAVDVPLENMVMDEPVYQPFKEHLVIGQTVHNQIYEEQPVQSLSSGDQAVLSAQSSDTHSSVEVNGIFQVAESQEAGHDLGVIFEGKTYRRRVFDPNLNGYVFLGRDNLQPRGGLLM